MDKPRCDYCGGEHPTSSCQHAAEEHRRMMEQQQAAAAAQKRKGCLVPIAGAAFAAGALYLFAVDHDPKIKKDEKPEPYPGLALAYDRTTDTAHPAQGKYSMLDARNRATDQCKGGDWGSVCFIIKETEAGNPHCILFRKRGYKAYLTTIKTPGVEDKFTAQKKECAKSSSKDELFSEKCYPAYIRHICNDAALTEEMKGGEIRDRALTDALEKKKQHLFEGGDFQITESALKNIERSYTHNMDVYVRTLASGLKPAFYIVTAHAPVLKAPDNAAERTHTLQRESCILVKPSTRDDFAEIVGFDPDGNIAKGFVAKTLLRYDGNLTAPACNIRFQPSP